MKPEWMKQMHTVFLCMLLLQAGLYGQRPLDAITRPKAAKPLLFNSLPDSFACRLPALLQILSANVDDSVVTQASDQFYLEGAVVEKVYRKAGVYSVNFRVHNYENALFNLSLQPLADNSIVIRGRMLHPRYGDLLVLERKGDRYFFKKKPTRLFMPE